MVGFLIKRKILFLWQRFIRGWDDSEIWDLFVQIAIFALPRIKRFKELHNGYPPELTPEKWNKVLDEIIYAFDEIIKSDDCNENPDVKRGLKLFHKYFFHFWD